MNDLHNLIGAAVENPHESTPIGMLADALDEAHPSSSDVRAELLRQAMGFFVVGDSEANPRISNLLSPSLPRSNRKSLHYRTNEPQRPGRGFGDTLDSISGYTVDHDQQVLDADGRTARIRTQLALDPDDRPADPFVRLTLTHPNSNNIVRVRMRVGKKRARDIADRLPNSQEVHQFLDTHFGPDPRTEKFAKVYSRALKKTT